MCKKRCKVFLFLTLFSLSPFLVGCSSGGSSGGFGGGSDIGKNHSDDQQRTTNHDYLVPQAPGTVLYGDATVSLDASNTSDGYIMVCHQGGVDKVKLQITTPDNVKYTYSLSIGSYEAFPLTDGNGTYHVDVLEHAYDDMYAIALSQDLNVTLSDEFLPFLYPNQYVWYTPDDEAVSFAASLSDKSSNDLDYVEQIYNYVIDNITYDDDLAENVQSGYLPDIDRTLDTKKGICFDYASLMSAMLRSQGIPTKLVVGYSGDVYHAWINVYLKEIGWVDNMIQFDGKDWVLMDPTLAANNSSGAVAQYIGDGKNYTVKYSY